MVGKNSYNQRLWLSILFFVLGIVFVSSIIFFFAPGPLIGTLLIAISIYWFAQWKFKKEISIKDSLILLLIPVFGAASLLLIEWQSPYGDNVFSLLVVLSILVTLVFFKKIKS